MEVLEIFETLLSKKLESAEIDICGYNSAGIGKLGITGVRFDKNCTIHVWHYAEGIKLQLRYKNHSAEQAIKIGSREHARLIEDILKLDEFICNRDEAEFLSYLNS